MTEKTNYVFSLLDKKLHKRADFSCDEESLDDYLKKRASQDVKKQVSAVHVMTTTDDLETILGYYTLSASSIYSDNIPRNIKKSLPRYDQVGTTLMGRLAVDSRFKGQGLGGTLLMDAFHRALLHSRQIGSIALVVDALHEQAKAFYLHYGFISLQGYSRKLFIPMNTIEKRLSSLGL